MCLAGKHTLGKPIIQGCFVKNLRDKPSLVFECSYDIDAIGLLFTFLHLLLFSYSAHDCILPQIVLDRVMN